jgi:hypothetical protein
MATVTQDMGLIEAWQNGVPLRHAWYPFAEASEQQLFLELESEGLHLEFVQSLKDKLIDGLYAGQFRAIGVENESGGGPIYIANYYFLKTAKIDWDKSTVAALGKQFHHVTVRSERDQADKDFAEKELVGPALARLEPEPVLHLPPTQQSPSRPRGRPSKTPEIDQAIDILLKKGVGLAKLPRPEAMAHIRNCAANELNSDINIGFSDAVLERILFRRFGPRR